MTEPPHSSRPLRIALVDDSPLRGHGLLFANLVRDRLSSHGVELAGYHCMGGDEGEGWCAEQKISWCPAPSSFQGRADAVIIPAASTPESHHGLLRAVLPLGLPVYIDKPLAATAEEGSELFAMARGAGVPLMSASALRFCVEVQSLRARFPAPHYVDVWSGWREEFDEFFIHPAELFMSLVRTAPVHVVRREISSDLVRYECADEAGAIIGCIHLCSGQQGFAATLSDGRSWHSEAIESRFFVQTIEAVLTFFRGGPPAVQEAETLDVLRLVDHCRELNMPRALHGALC